MMIKAISYSEFETEVLPILNRFFAIENAFSPRPFASDVSAKRILFDWRYKYSVDPPLLLSLIEAAKSIGDSGFYLRGHVSEKDDIAAWYVPCSEIESYTQSQDSPLRRATSFEQTLFSPSGQWGILTSHETHMLLGSMQQFMNKLKELVPDLDDQVLQFLEHWQYVKNTGGSSSSHWLPGLMYQVYGHEEGAQMLQNAGLP